MTAPDGRASVLLVGGARSGKSSAALALAEAAGAPVTIVVTAEAFDDEMADRISRHRAERPAGWTTIEAPCDLLAAVEVVADADTLVLDCLTLWLSNRVLDGADGRELELEADAVACRLAARRGLTVVVSNEVGSGIVPADALSRSFRDTQGRVNQVMAGHLAATMLVVAGRLVPTLAPGRLLELLGATQ